MLLTEVDPMFDQLREAYNYPPCEAHAEFLHAWRAWSQIQFGSGFPHQYVGAGSSEVIRALIMNNSTYRLHIFEGEYEGYRHFAQAPVVVHPRSLEALSAYRFMNSDQFWISHPSAIDGEYWSDLAPFLTMLQERYPTVKVYLDVAYHGIATTPECMVPESFPNIAGVIFSLSKLFGTYRFRIGGCITRQIVPSLVGNQWFTNYLSLKFGTKLLETCALSELAIRYKELQVRVVTELKKEGTLPQSTEPANVLILARSPEGPSEFRRAPLSFRYCLTPALANMIRKGVMR